MVIHHALIFASDCRFHSGSVRIRNGVFTEVRTDGRAAEPEAGEPALDARGNYLIPGLVDIHFHGAVGADVSDDTDEAFRKIAAYEAREGITAICPATLTLAEERLCSILRRGHAFSKSNAGRADCADLIGFNMEGPFISRARKGAQNEKYIRACDVNLAERFIDASGGLVRYIGVAPEENPEAEAFIRRISARTGVSLAHTDADYETALRAFRAGASHVVHLYNAMPDMLHRAPGVIGAAADTPEADAELICDGIHVHPSAVRNALRMFGPDRIVFISDSLRSTGMPDGRYDLGGQTVEKKGRECRLASDGHLAGSVSSLMECLRNAVLGMGIPLETAVASATANPAKSIREDALYGSIGPGKKGHAVILTKGTLRTAAVIKDGRKITGREDAAR